MITRSSWSGVDWYGCEDDLAWETLASVPAVSLSARSTAALPSVSPSKRRRGGRTRGRSASSAAAAPTRRVLILDVENVCPSSRRPVRALARLQAVLAAAGPVDQVIAASAASQHARLDALLGKAGVQVHTRCKNRPNAADRALIEAARDFARSGDCEVIVASNDHSFSAIAHLPGVRRMVLITHPQLATARSLIRVASELRVAA